MTSKRLALTITALNLGMVLIGPILSLVYGVSFDGDIRSASAILYSVLGALIIVRLGSHMVGWLLLVVGFFSALGEIGHPISFLEPIPPNLLTIFRWYGSFAWVPALMIPITLVLQFFPNGRLPSRRWWPVTAASLAGMGGLMASLAFHPWPWIEHGLVGRTNPLGIPGSEYFFERLLSISQNVWAAGLLGSVAALIVRFRRARGVERIQMKWVFYAAVVGIAFLLIHSFLGEPLGLLPFVSLPAFLAAAIGLAILRHRLFDIDILIRRTLVYGALTGALAVVYFASIILLQRLIPAQTQLATVLSTLAIAALFSPFRSRIQRTVDRRFFRRNYDAAQTLATFTARARDQVDLEQLNRALVEVVEESMQPAVVSLWIREGGRSAG